MTRRRAALAILAAVTVALAGLVAHSALELRQLRAEDAGREAAVRAAESEVIGLISVSSATTEADLARLAEGATSSFRSQLEQQSKALRKALRGQQVTSSGTVASSGVVSYSAERAKVLVAAKGSVANKAAQQAGPRSYRLHVDLQRVDGRWLVSGLEFVA